MGDPQLFHRRPFASSGPPARAAAAPLEYIVLESDGPYNYRGLRLSPAMIPEAARVVAEIKGVPVERVLEAARRNSERLLYS